MPMDETSRAGLVPVTPGMANVFARGRMSDRACEGCGMGMPIYPGRYPSKCPKCGGAVVRRSDEGVTPVERLQTRLNEEIVPTPDNLGVPRAQMPQIDDPDHFVAWLRLQGVAIVPTTADARFLKPTQTELDTDKVAAFADASDEVVQKPVITSKDDRLIDGHHRWMFRLTRDTQAQIAVLQVQLTAQELLKLCDDYPGVERRGLEEAYYGGIPQDPDSTAYGGNRSTGKPMTAIVRVVVSVQQPDRRYGQAGQALYQLQKQNEGVWFAQLGGSTPTFTRDPRQATVFRLVQATLGQASRQDEDRLRAWAAKAPAPFNVARWWRWDFATLSEGAISQGSLDGYLQQFHGKRAGEQHGRYVFTFTKPEDATAFADRVREVVQDYDHSAVFNYGLEVEIKKGYTLRPGYSFESALPVVACSVVPRLQALIEAGSESGGPWLGDAGCSRGRTIAFEALDGLVPGGLKGLQLFLEGPAPTGRFFRLEGPRDPALVFEFDTSNRRMTVFASQQPERYLGYDPRADLIVPEALAERDDDLQTLARAAKSGDREDVWRYRAALNRTGQALPGERFYRDIAKVAAGYLRQVGVVLDAASKTAAAEPYPGADLTAKRLAAEAAGARSGAARLTTIAGQLPQASTAYGNHRSSGPSDSYGSDWRGRARFATELLREAASHLRDIANAIEQEQQDRGLAQKVFNMVSWIFWLADDVSHTRDQYAGFSWNDRWQKPLALAEANDESKRIVLADAPIPCVRCHRQTRDYAPTAEGPVCTGCLWAHLYPQVKQVGEASPQWAPRVGPYRLAPNYGGPPSVDDADVRCSRCGLRAKRDIVWDGSRWSIPELSPHSNHRGDDYTYPICPKCRESTFVIDPMPPAPRRLNEEVGGKIVAPNGRITGPKVGQGATRAHGGFRFEIGHNRKRTPRKDIAAAIQNKLNAKRGLARRIQAAKQWHRSPQGRAFHRDLARFNTGNRRGNLVEDRGEVFWHTIVPYALGLCENDADQPPAPGSPADRTVDDIFDALLRKLIVIESLDVLQDVEFSDDGAIYLFFDPSLGAHEISEIVLALQAEQPKATLVGSPDQSLPGETAKADWWVVFSPNPNAPAAPPNPAIYAWANGKPGQGKPGMVKAAPTSVDKLALSIDVQKLVRSVGKPVAKQAAPAAPPQVPAAAPPAVPVPGPRPAPVQTAPGRQPIAEGSLPTCCGHDHGSLTLARDGEPVLLMWSERADRTPRLRGTASGVAGQDISALCEAAARSAGSLFLIRAAGAPQARQVIKEWRSLKRAAPNVWTNDDALAASWRQG